MRGTFSATSLFMVLAVPIALSRPGADLSAQDSVAVPDPIRAVIDVTETYPPIHPFLYGHFLENFRHWFEAGVWAEMIGDRKFFHAISNDPLDPPNSREEFGVGRWWTVGPEERIVMDSTRAHAGAHSPRVRLEGPEPRGIRQDGIGLREDEEYTGRIVLAGDPTARVEVSLLWGPDPDDRQTIEISLLSDEYVTFPLAFTAGADTRDGDMRVTGTGAGSFHIGAVSLMPADNVEGFHREVLELAREMKPEVPTMLRWGGNFSSNYEWRDGIGDPDQRPPQYDQAWGAIEPNDVGTFEILALNRLLGTEPNIGVNAGFGDAYSAALWVEYVNGSIETPMGRLRAEHGHPEPFDVKWWGIGNEMYGRWQMGHMAIDQYVQKHNQFARRMRAVDPSIVLVASGATPYQMAADSDSEPFIEDAEPVFPPFEIGSTQDWTGQLLTHSYEHFDYISEHFYGPGLSAYDAETQTWYELEDVPLEDEVRRFANRVRGAAEMWEEYHRRMPWLEDADIGFVVDEWASSFGEVRRLMWTTLVLNEMFRHTDVFEMSAHTGWRRCFDHDRYATPVLRACGLLFKMYTDHLGSIPVAVDGNSPQRELPGTVGVDRPREYSGTATYPLDVFAALSEDESRLTVAVANPSDEGHTLDLDIRGATLPGEARRWTIAAPSYDAENLAGQDPMIRLEESSVSDVDGTVTVAPFSVDLYEFRIR